jgi:hypothetical protein
MGYTKKTLRGMFRSNPTRQDVMAESSNTPNPGSFDVELLLEQARTFLAFGEEMRQCSEHLQENAQGSADWSSALRQHFEQFRTAVAATAGDPEVNPELARLWTLILDTWQRTAESMESASIAPPANWSSAAWQAYQQTQNQYLRLLQRTASEALDLMEQRLSESAASGRDIDSLRELYNLWVDCNEESYGRMLRNAEYSELSGRLLNALLRCYAPGETPS